MDYRLDHSFAEIPHRVQTKYRKTNGLIRKSEDDLERRVVGQPKKISRKNPFLNQQLYEKHPKLLEVERSGRLVAKIQPVSDELETALPLHSQCDRVVPLPAFRQK